MLTIETGDPERFLGRALVYSHNRGGEKGNEDNPLYPSVFVGSDPFKVLEAMSEYGLLPRENLEEANQKAREILGQISSAENSQFEQFLDLGTESK